MSDVYAANLTLVYLIIENNGGPFIYGLLKDPVSTSHYVASRARKGITPSAGSDVGLFKDKAFVQRNWDEQWKIQLPNTTKKIIVLFNLLCMKNVVTQSSTAPFLIHLHDFQILPLGIL